MLDWVLNTPLFTFWALLPHRQRFFTLNFTIDLNKKVQNKKLKENTYLYISTAEENNSLVKSFSW